MVQRQFRIDDFIKGLRAGGEVFHAVTGPLDRAGEPPRRGADEDLFRIERSLAAKTAAHVRRHDANLVAGKIERRRQRIAHDARDLRRGMQRQRVAPRLVFGKARPGLDGDRRLAMHAEAAADAHRRGGKRLVRLAAFELPVHQHVGAGFFMQERHSGTHGLLRVNDGGQRFVVDNEELERVLGEVAVFGDDTHDRLADIAHLAARQRQDRCGVIMGHARGRDQRLDRAGQILGGENSDDARGGARSGSVDRANARMRLVAPAEGDVQRAHHLPIIGEGAVARQEARILGPFDARADELRPGVDVRRVIHRRRRLCASSPTALRHGRKRPWRRAPRCAGSRPAIWSVRPRSRCCAERRRYRGSRVR